MPRGLARELVREASLDLARLRRIRGASHKTWHRIARAEARLAFAAALLAAPPAEPAAAADPVFRHALPTGRPALANAALLESDPTFADIDGDGDLDVFVGEYSGSTRFFENTGTATQAALAPGRLGPFGLRDVGYRAELSFADLDGDGDLDATIGTFGSGGPEVQFFRNTGTATAPAFAAPVANPFGLTSWVTALADLDGDGDLDALRPIFLTPPYSGGQDQGMVLHENTGSASAPAFAPAVTHPFGLAAFAHGFADLDGDGDLDGFGTRIRFENSGSATSPAFATPVTFVVAGGVPDESRFDFADLDGDGDLDGLAAGYDVELEDATSAWLENVGSAGVPSLTTLGNPFGLGPAGALALADLDGDGDLDAFTEIAAFLDNVGTPTAPAFVRVPLPTLALSGNDPVLADLDGDGDPDALVGLLSGDLLLFENTGSASDPDFAAPLTNPLGLANLGGNAAPELADLDGDGDLDALIGNAAGDVWLFENTGSATSPAFASAQPNPLGLSNVSSFASPTLVDIDGDGDLDAMVGSYSGAVFFFPNTGTASEPAFGAPTADPFGFAFGADYASPEFADIDGDGDLDAFRGSETGPVFFRNTGSASAPAFAGATTAAPGLNELLLSRPHAAPELADVDADGDLDAVIGVLAGRIGYFPNRGTPTAPRFISIFSPNPFGIPALAFEPDFADLDADGDLDLFLGTSFSASAPDWYENTGGASKPGFGERIDGPFGLASVTAISAAPLSADLDADGDLDLLLGRSDGNLIYVANTGSASAPAFGAPTTNPFGLADVGSDSSPDLADLDGDGDLDALVGAGFGDTIFFENTGSAAAPAFADALVNPFGLSRVGSLASPEVADVDGDGDLDVLVSDGAGVVFFENVLLDPACDNTLDDDGDGLHDLVDPGCVSPSDPSEFTPDAELWSCGTGPEALLLAPLFAAARRRRRSPPSGSEPTRASAPGSALCVPLPPANR